LAAKGTEERLSAGFQFVFKAFAAVTVSAGPGFGAVLVAAFLAVMGVLDPG
jgi:hypothetical protein